MNSQNVRKSAIVTAVIAAKQVSPEMGAMMGCDFGIRKRSDNEYQAAIAWAKTRKSLAGRTVNPGRNNPAVKKPKGRRQ